MIRRNFRQKKDYPYCEDIQKLHKKLGILGCELIAIIISVCLLIAFKHKLENRIFLLLLIVFIIGLAINVLNMIQISHIINARIEIEVHRERLSNAKFLNGQEVRVKGGRFTGCVGKILVSDFVEETPGNHKIKYAVDSKGRPKRIGHSHSPIRVRMEEDNIEIA